MASTLKINTLTGVSTAGSIAVTGEGNSTTTNLQQGLAKMWTHADHSGSTAINDSFNTSSITDVSTAFMKYTSTNNMSSANYAVTLCYQPVDNNNGTDHFNVFASQTTSVNESRHYENGSTFDCDDQVNIRHGDLA
tara:strand:+ start:287 stop:694 length:408 start_codon:yes stop_codon:yes gene_type:complete